MLRRGSLHHLTGLPLGLLPLALTAGSAACSPSEPNWRPAAAPLEPPTALAERPQEIEQLRVVITDGQFGAGRYDPNPGVIRLWVIAQGGPYTLSIDPLLDPTELPGDRIQSVDFTAPQPGQYTMGLSGAGAGTAVLNVTAPGA